MVHLELARRQYNCSLLCFLLYHVTVSLVSLSVMALCLILLHNELICPPYWKYFSSLLQVNVTLEAVTWEVSLTEDVLPFEGIPLSEMQEANIHSMVRKFILMNVPFLLYSCYSFILLSLSSSHFDFYWWVE